MNHNRKLCHRNPKVHYSEGRNESVIARTNKGKVTMIFFVANRWLNWIFPKECSAAGFPERNRASHEIYYDGMHSKLIPLRWFICLPLHSNTASFLAKGKWSSNVYKGGRTSYTVSTANILSYLNRIRLWKWPKRHLSNVEFPGKFWILQQKLSTILQWKS